MRNHHNTTAPTAHETRVFSTSSRSSSSRSYSPSSTSSVLPQTPRIRTLDQVWRDLSFPPPPPPPPPPPASLHHNQNPSSTPSSFRGVILQDFLAGPFKDIHHSSSARDRNPDPDDFPLPLPPTTALSLNSGLEFVEYNSNSAAACHRRDNCIANAPPFAVPGFSDAVMGSPPAVGLFSFCPNERPVLESPCSLGGGDRRHKRMMKNRESAARSRARKQAYTNELELEVAHLVAENEKLKKQHEELRLAMAAQHSTKKSLQRTLTAPF